MTNKLILRTTTPEDASAIFQFYRDHQTGNISGRDEGVQRERIAAGATTIIHDEAGRIHASAIAYPVMDETSGDARHKWTEVGSVLVGKENRGLFKPLVSALIVRAYLTEPPQECFMLDIVADNAKSIHAFSTVGARPYDDMPGNLRTRVMASLRNENPLIFFRIGKETVPELAINLLAARDNPKLRRPAGEREEYELDLSRNVLFTELRSALLETAARGHSGVRHAPQSVSPSSSQGIPNMGLGG